MHERKKGCQAWWQAKILEQHRKPREMDILSGWEGDGGETLQSLGNSPSETSAKDDVTNPHQRPDPWDLWLTTEAAPVSG